MKNPEMRVRMTKDTIVVELGGIDYIYERVVDEYPYLKYSGSLPTMGI